MYTPHHLVTTMLYTPLLGGPLGGGLGDLAPGELMLVVMFALAGLCFVVSFVLALFLVVWAAIMAVASLFQALIRALTSSPESEMPLVDSEAVSDRR